MNHVLRFLFFTLVVRPAVLFILGLNVRHRERLPKEGPAIIAANHNSHLDAMVLMTLFPKRMLPKLRPVAALDYFFRYRLLKWFALRIVGIIPLDRQLRKTGQHPLAPISQSLERGDIVILFPEGTRGDPEKLGEFKTGIAHLAQQHAQVPIYPIYMHGLGKALPRGEALLIPFFCDVFIGEPLLWTGDRDGFVDELSQRVKGLIEEGHFAEWQ
jgi:1-acyl-sn-glycerol-3-phosphate acyltransferase